MEITDRRDFDIADAKELIIGLPPANAEIIRYLFEFLAEVAVYSPQNKMSPPNLGKNNVFFYSFCDLI